MVFLLICILISYVIVLAVSIKFRFAATALFLAVTTRVTLFFINYWGIYRVPGADHDAAHFISRSLAKVDLSWENLISQIDPSGGGENYAILGAAIAKVLGNGGLAIPAVNLVFASFMVSLVFLLVLKIWGERAAVAAVLALALYPFSLFNSVIAMREEISTLFGVLGSAAIIIWSRKGSFYYLYLSALFFLMAASFHPGWSGALVGLALFSSWRTVGILKVANSGATVTRNELSLILSCLAFVVGVAVLFSLPGFSLLNLFDGYVSDDADIGDAITSRFIREARGGSAYPGFIATGDPLTQPWLIPMRILYFLFSPFPWDIRSPRHLLGLVSSVLYIYIAWQVYRNWPKIKSRQELIPIIFIVACLIFVFAVGVTNIGTAIRHKTKFFPLVLIFGAVAFQNLRVRFGR